MATKHCHEVKLSGPYEIVSKFKELLIQSMLCANCVRHQPRKSVLDADDTWHLTYCFEMNGEADREGVVRLLDSLHDEVYSSLKVNWTSLDEFGDLPPQMIASFPPA